MRNTNKFVILSMIGILVFCGGNNKNVVVGQECKGDTLALIKQCPIYVEKSGPMMKPSELCCQVIKSFAVTDASCICKNLPDISLELIDIPKVIYFAKSCGNPIPSGTNCAGVIVS